jgi:tetratricopeptide (TPR) repeat protein
MIVRNEEKFLDGCLSSVKGLVDEIVIVDTGSTDNTLAIARIHGAIISSFTWCDDFSAARNEALRRTTGDWVLYLDADERLASGQGEMLRSLIGKEHIGAYLITVGGEIRLQTGTFGHANAYPRLFRKYPGVQFEGDVHEQIGPSIERSGKPIRPSDLVIEHLGYNQSVETTRDKCHRNIALLRKQLKRNTADAYARFQLGNTLTILKEFDEAKRELTTSLQAKILPPSIKANICNLLAEIAVNEGEFDDAIRDYHSSLRFAPNQRMARWFLSGVLLNLKRFPEALPVLRELAALPDGILSSGGPAYDLKIDPADLQFRLGYCLERLGEWLHAAHAYAESLQNKGDFNEALPQLLGVERHLSLPDAIVILQQAYGASLHEEIAFALARRQKEAGDLDGALKTLEARIDCGTTNLEIVESFAQWAVGGADPEQVARVWRKIQERNIHSFQLDRYGLQRSLQQRDVRSAIDYLRSMIANIPDHLSHMIPQLHAFENKLSSQLNQHA